MELALFGLLLLVLSALISAAVTVFVVKHRQKALEKKLRSARSRLDQLDQAVSTHVSQAALDDLHAQLDEIRQKIHLAPDFKLQALVNRVNVLSDDLSATKIELVEQKKSLESLRISAKWAGIAGRRSSETTDGPG